MDREILFRGKRIDTGKWVEGSLISFGKNMKAILLSKTKAYRPKDTEFFCSINCCDVIPETVGQYTGIYDKNGRRIFEGDIVKYSMAIAGEIPFNGTNAVIFKDCGFRIRRSDCFLCGVDDKCEIQVIGNIHDNSELLEVI